MLRFLLAPVLALSASACAISTSRTNVVVVTDSKTVVASCKKLGEVDGNSVVGSLVLRDTARDAAMARLKAAGADLGASHVESPVADTRWRGRSATGTAYKC